MQPANLNILNSHPLISRVHGIALQSSLVSVRMGQGKGNEAHC